MAVLKQEPKRRKLARNLVHSEAIIERVLAEDYRWPRPLIADFLHCLRKETEEA